MDGIKFQTKFDIRYSLVRRLVERRRIQKNVAYDTENATVAATLMRAAGGGGPTGSWNADSQ